MGALLQVPTLRETQRVVTGERGLFSGGSPCIECYSWRGLPGAFLTRVRAGGVGTAPGAQAASYAAVPDSFSVPGKNLLPPPAPRQTFDELSSCFSVSVLPNLSVFVIGYVCILFLHLYKFVNVFCDIVNVIHYLYLRFKILL